MSESLEQLNELMAGYVLGNLSPEEAELLQNQLNAHPELADEVQQLQQVLEAMPYALPKAFPSDRLRDQILTSTRLPVPPPRRRKLAPIWGIAVGAVAVVAMPFALENYRLHQQVSTLQSQVATQHDVIAMLQQPKTHLVSLKGMERAADASGSIVITPGEPKAVLVLQNLPSLPEGQFYQLWAIADGQKVPWERFTANKRGIVFTKLSLPANSPIASLMVTVETSPANQPTGPMVMTTNL